MSEGGRKKVKETVEGVEPVKVEAINKAFGDLVNACVRLSIKIAKCKCENREKCDVYKYALKVAEIVDNLQELAEK